MKINSIKFKLCFLYVGVLGLILVGYRAVLYYNLYKTLYRDSNNRLITKANHVQNTLHIFAEPFRESKRAVIYASKRMLGADVTYPDKKQLERMESLWFRVRDGLELNKDYINILNSEGKTVVSSKNIDRGLAWFLEEYPQTGGKEYTFHNVVYKESLNLRIVVVPMDFGNLGHYTLQIGISTDPIIYILRERIQKSAVSIPLIMLLAVVISYLLVWRILRPVKQVAKIANDISHENLSARVDVKNIDEEMKYLAESFNDMIGRLEESFSHVEDFSSYVAHELRTPLTIIKGETEVALQTGQTVNDFKSVMCSNIQEVDKMLKTIDYMLLLADMQYRKHSKFERVDLGEFLQDIYEKSTILATTKNITVNLDVPKEKIQILASPTELRRAFFNLIDNAIKFTPVDGNIAIKAERHKDKVHVSITDTGIGIKDEDIPKIFKKFFRSSSQGEQSQAGSGLGLGIAQSIVRVHQGRIEVRSRAKQGSTFIVILPVQ